jgi:hypothetical protein
LYHFGSRFPKEIIAVIMATWKILETPCLEAAVPRRSRSPADLKTAMATLLYGWVDGLGWFMFLFNDWEKTPCVVF